MFWEGSDEGYPDSEVVVTVRLPINTILCFLIRCGGQVSGRGKAISVTQEHQSVADILRVQPNGSEFFLKISMKKSEPCEDDEDASAQ